MCIRDRATIEILTEEGFLDSVNARGEQLRSGLERLQNDYPVIEHIRGAGIMIAADLATASDTAAVVQHCLNESNLLLMTAGAAGNTIRFMPPLTVSEEEVDLAIDALNKALASLQLV